MPMTKQVSMVASRTKISMCRPSSLERRGFAACLAMLRDGVIRRAEENPLDDEEQEADAADGNRQIGNADRQEGEIGDRVVPGHLDQPFAPHDHEECDQRHQELNEKIEWFLKSARQLIGKISDVHV